MTKLILQIFGFLKSHTVLRWTSLTVFTAMLVLLMIGQTYKEDISDFLPLDTDQQQAFQEYQNSPGARRIFVIFQSSSPSCQEAADYFCELLDHSDAEPSISYRFSDDPEVLQEAMSAIYSRMPYLLTADDYARMDSLLADSTFISRQLEADKQMLMLPTAGMLTLQIQHDPLNLFGPVLQRVKPAPSDDILLLIDSPFGASETEHNAELVTNLQHLCDSVNGKFSEVSVHLTGGPVIAVGNARQIKTDSVFSIALAVVLIFLLLWVAFRNFRNLLLIAFSIGWGWLFAMGSIALVHNGVSIIVIGISSVILGIAVNYPLHLIAHLSHTADTRTALKEITIPLVVGNITTVGAFLALVPLESVALRDLGLFSSMLLVGTIVFVLLWLPHMVHHSPKAGRDIFGKIGDVQLEQKKWLVWTVAALTLVLGYFSLQTSFDADLRNINYMTAEQRHDMQQLDRMYNYQSEVADLSRWNEWRTGKGAAACRQLRQTSADAGFAADSFADFYTLISIPPADEIKSLTTTIVNNLSDNFNYIGWACGFIVFFFLWFSLGSIELALLSFLPMAVSWVWILGIMSLFDIQFNVVNIILATFIFGQGDDYTIFMTEGCQYEYAYRRKMLSSYKHSIIISALIMFIGIGALIVARHPALFSLAQVTIIGMFSVVLMAYLFPPLIFRWLVYSNGRERRRPLTILNLFRRRDDSSIGSKRNAGDRVSFISDCYRYRGIEITTSVDKRLRRYSKKGYLMLIERELSSSPRTVVFINGGWGEIPMYFALQHPDIRFISIETDPDKRCVAANASQGRAGNISFVAEYKGAGEQSAGEQSTDQPSATSQQTFLLSPGGDDVRRYSFLHPTIIE